MAKVSNNLIGKTTKSVGGITFTTWKGINIIKNKVSNPKNPKTPKQLEQREKMTVIVAIYKESPDIYRKGFRAQAIQKSEYNVFLAKNINLIFKPDLSLDETKFLISDGGIESTNIKTATFTTATKTLVVTWEKNETTGGKAQSDIALISAIEWNKQQKKITQVKTLVDGVARSAGTASIVLDNALQAGGKVSVYLGFTDIKGNKQATSTYKEAT